MNYKNKTLVNTFTYLGFNALNGLIPFLLIPILTRYLDAEEYGKVSIFTATFAFLFPIIGLNVATEIERVFFKLDKKGIAKTIGAILYLLIFSICFFTLIFALFVAFEIEHYFFSLPNIWLLLIPLVCGIYAVNTVYLVILRNNNLAIKFGVFQGGLTLMNLVISLYLVVIADLGWEGRLWGIVISYISVGIICLYSLYKEGFLELNFNLQRIKEVFLICFPLLFHALGAFFIFRSNLFFIENHLGLMYVGVFSISYSYAVLMGIVQDAVSKTVSPWLYKNLNNDSDVQRVKIARMNIALYLAYLLIAVISYFVMKELIIIMTTEEYHSAVNYLFVLLLALAFNGMYKLSSVYLIHYSKTKQLSLITSILAILSIFFNYFLIKEFGLYGAGYAFLICMFLQFLMTAIYARRIHPLPYKRVLFSVNNFRKKNEEL